MKDHSDKHTEAKDKNKGKWTKERKTVKPCEP